ncbi:MAG TPA: right-handed parallel beta-helix repeat-containing protein [Verrucomicrobiae bacterium]|nr:right-handed parallel beta-helix repeat-containing protein [Verrucomicrobiae bacterium]
MKIRNSIVIALISAFSLQPSALRAQGSLTPPGPPAPTMKSLNQIEARTPVSLLPYTITNPGSYYLTTNLTGVSGANGITIASGDVTLDLNGFRLLGVPGSLDGIFVPTNALYLNLTVRNGTVRGWNGSGVEAFNGENTIFERLTVSDVGGFGIDAYGSVIRDCQVDGSGNTGIAADVSEIRHCVVENCGFDGIDTFDSQVSGCVLEFNLYGIFAAPGKVSDCVIETNTFSGIYAGASGCQLTGNTCLGNNQNAGANDAGIYLATGNNRVEDNHVIGSGHAGIQVAAAGASNNLIIRNSVTGNGANNYVIPASQIIGPLITTAGTITNSNPWANFSF